jgi:YD repeat-containing protein
MKPFRVVKQLAALSLSVASGLAYGQVATDFTTVFKYDALRRLVGQIEPAADASTPVKRASQRFTYSADGLLTKVERGTAASASDTDFNAMTVLDQTDIAYNAIGYKVQEAQASGGSAYALTQYSYDADGRLSCAALRMNLASPPPVGSNACALGVTNAFDKAGRLSSSTQTTAGVNWALGYQYDAAGNRKRITHPDGTYFTYDYDALNRVTTILENGVASGAGYLARLQYDELGRRTDLKRGDASNYTDTTYCYMAAPGQPRDLQGCLRGHRELQRQSWLHPQRAEPGTYSPPPSDSRPWRTGASAGT